jgi:dihydropteroate synthase
MFDTIRDDTRPLLMGILNVTMDSFSDGGAYATTAQAVLHALTMIEHGADMIDVGGESTRPGARPVSDAEQIARVVPVIRELSRVLPEGVVISTDTRSPLVAAAALEAGAGLINDISAGSAPDMFQVVAEHAAGIVLMHIQGTPATMQDNPSYVDVVAEIRDYLLRRTDAAIAAGINPERVAIDPGIGFGKTRQHNLRLLAALGSFVASGYPVLLGTSRKRFMGAICAETIFSELIGATCATTALGVAAGVRIFRVHDVKPNRQAADVAWACQSVSQ